MPANRPKIVKKRRKRFIRHQSERYLRVKVPSADLVSTLSLPSSKSMFSQPFKDKFISEVVRIGSITIFLLSKLGKARFSILCDVIFLVKLQGKFEIDHLGSEKGYHAD